jgi:hypothetical protein
MQLKLACPQDSPGPSDFYSASTISDKGFDLSLATQTDSVILIPTHAID